VLGKVLGGTALGFGQGMLMLLLGPLVGISLGWEAALGAAAAIFLTALGLSALGFFLAWRMDSVQGFHAIMNLLLMPMWLMSGALFPAAGASPWLRWAMAANPLTYGMDALRGALHSGAATESLGGHPPGLALAVMGAFALAMVLLSVWVASRQEKG